MRAVMYEAFGAPLEVRDAPDPVAPPGGVVIRVEATGLCRSDRHGWQGHDPDIRVFPHVPGHELAGTLAEVGAGVTGWKPGARVAVPFVCACGRCRSCRTGDQQVCENQTQPGFTHWGSFAEYVVVNDAEVNLIALPDDLTYAAAAGLGCRFATAFRAVVTHGRPGPGDWVAVHGCGGVGLSAVMTAAAMGAQVIAVDVAPAALDLASRFGAAVTIDASRTDVVEAVHEASDGGVQVSLDALGSPVTARDSIAGLRRRGRHVQVGLVLEPAELPLHLVIGRELEILGSHGMAAHAYAPLMGMVQAGTLDPEALITRTITLDEAPAALEAMDTPGITMIHPRP
ncbi:zinc-dependent alcohol dehydrogenase family protein [Spirillospora sp. NPDC047279]|uniref:zinc-dependent alcohol dehydrogenase family protein n=1 Tax=Spirillospora sp. NPDC047279 TaxID=3155478 RepID=UPI0033C5E78F